MIMRLFFVCIIISIIINQLYYNDPRRRICHIKAARMANELRIASSEQWIEEKRKKPNET